MKQKETEEKSYLILIVEDSFEAGKFLRTALETMKVPFEVTLLPSAEEAILALADAAYDLLIVDIQLPGMNGIDLVKRVRRKDRVTRIIMQTGVQDERLISSLDTIQLDGFIQKPFKVGQIVDAVKTALNLPQSDPIQPAEISPVVEEAKFQNPDQVETTLRDLIQRLGATETIVLDSKGAILFHVSINGASAASVEMFPSILKARTATKELQRYVQTDSPRNIFVLRGKSTDILIATIYQYTLVLMLNTGATALKVSLAFEELIHIQESFTRELYRRPTQELKQPAADHPIDSFINDRVELDEPSVDPIPMISDETFEKLLSSSLQKSSVPNENLDTYWESAADSRFHDQSGKNLSYDEAKKRGIGPID
jgi:DNA-binding response OmpR family regulator